MVTHLTLDDVVALNALIVTAIGLSFAFGRKGREAPSLDLKGRRMTAYDEIPPEQRVHHRDRNDNVTPIGKAGKAQQPAVMTGRVTARVPGNSYGASALQRLEVEEANLRPSESRQLNVFFNWNGHTWDAFEVLGIPAGANRDLVIRAFHACRAKSPESTAFLQAAADSILKKR